MEIGLTPHVLVGGERSEWEGGRGRGAGEGLQFEEMKDAKKKAYNVDEMVNSAPVCMAKSMPYSRAFLLCAEPS